MRSFLLTISLFACFTIVAQGHKKKSPPVLHEVSNKEIVQSVYPDAVKVEKQNDYWFKIVNAKSKILGYALSSEPFCKNVIGYNNTTPVLIVTDKNRVIRKIAILSNWETPSYVIKLETKGFFNLWNGKSLAEAKKVQLDAYTGATLTAKAVKQNVDFLIENGLKVSPKQKKQ